MIYLLFSILSSTIIALVFKLIDIRKTDLFSVIVINYFTALACGFFVFDGEISIDYIITSTWFPLSLIIGSMLIIGFYLIGYTTQKAGIAITTIANKMSVIIPVLFSLFYFSEAIGLIKLSGIVIALAAVLMAVYRKPQGNNRGKFSLLPIIMFMVIGLIDSLIKLAQAKYIPVSDVSIFTSFSFGIAGVIGLIVLFIRKNSRKNFHDLFVWLFGISIGIANFGSIYFLIFALNSSGFDSSIVYGVNHVAVILLSITLGIWIFKEKINKINIVGIVLALIAITILTVLN